MVVKPVIKGVHVVPMGFSNAFLIEGDDRFNLNRRWFPGRGRRSSVLSATLAVPQANSSI